MICVCCGLEIQGKSHGPYHRLSGVVDYACDRCWKDPAIFFPDRVNSESSGTSTQILSRILDPKATQSDVLRVGVMELKQGNVTAYIGKMKPTDVLDLYDLKRWSVVQLDGYQRGLYEERKKEVAQYLRNCPIPVLPAILVSIRGDSRFISENGDFGFLEIPKRKGSIILIDGQHRVSGFEWYAEQMLEMQAGDNRIKLDRLDLMRILSFEVPVVFLNSETAAEVLNRDRDSTCVGNGVTPEDVERVVFYTLNKTQRGIAPSLQDVLKFFIGRSGIRGIPSIERDGWRVSAAEIGYRMNTEASPLKGMINLSGGSGMGPVQLNSFVTSMKPLFTLQSFLNLSPESKYGFIKVYWSVLKELFKEGFQNSTDYLILKSIAIYSLNWLAADIYRWCDSKNGQSTAQDVLGFLQPLRGFNWRTKGPEPSPLKAFGGTVGARQAYRILLKRLARGGVSEARERLRKLKVSQVKSHSPS